MPAKSPRRCGAREQADEQHRAGWFGYLGAGDGEAGEVEGEEVDGGIECAAIDFERQRAGGGGGDERRYVEGVQPDLLFERRARGAGGVGGEVAELLGEHAVAGSDRRVAEAGAIVALADRCGLDFDNGGIDRREAGGVPGKIEGKYVRREGIGGGGVGSGGVRVVARRDGDQGGKRRGANRIARAETGVNAAHAILVADEHFERGGLAGSNQGGGEQANGRDVGQGMDGQIPHKKVPPSRRDCGRDGTNVPPNYLGLRHDATNCRSRALPNRQLGQRGRVATRPYRPRVAGEANEPNGGKLSADGDLRRCGQFGARVAFWPRAGPSLRAGGVFAETIGSRAVGWSLTLILSHR